jgi:hypothetical protein
MTRGRVVLALSLLAVMMPIGVVRGQEPLPSAPLQLFDGTTLSLHDLKGQVVVIRFLASW